MIPQLGTVAKYTLKTKFTPLNGIYKLERIRTFDAALADGVDFVKSIYTPCELTDADYQADADEYRSSVVLTLTYIDDETIVRHIPYPAIDLTPDPMIIKCENLYIAIDIGLVKDPNKYKWLINQLNEMTRSVTGTDKMVQLMSVGSVYVTQADYDTIEADRTIRIEQIDSLQKTVTGQSELISKLTTRLQHYEDIIKALAPPETP